MRWWWFSMAMVLAVGWGKAWPLLLMPIVIAGDRRFGLLLTLAYCYGLMALDQGLAARLPEALNGVTLPVNAKVVGLPLTETAWRYGKELRRQKLELVIRLSERPERWPGRHRVRVSAWAPLPLLRAGQEFTGTLRLYFPQGLYNEAGVDWARLDLSNRLDARGTLTTVERLSPPALTLDRVREAVAARLAAKLTASPLGAAVMPALVAGDRRGIDDHLWSLFRDLGTAHLLAISGLHLTLVVGLLLGLGRWVVGPLVQVLVAPARAVALQQLAWWPALAGAYGYAALAGFGVPTRRALIMVTVLALCQLRRRGLPPGRALAVALAAVLVADPLAALSEGLWLSFAAVAVIVLLMGAGRMPVMVALPVVMAALGSWLFGAWAWWSPLANLLLVPLFSLWVVPLALLGLVLDQGWMLLAAAAGVELATAIMELMHAWPVPPLPAPDATAAAFLLAALLLMLLPAYPWPRRLLPLWLLPWWWPSADLPGPGQVDVIVFDVGQGQALALRTSHHLLLYDVGPGWPGGSVASQVLVPWLRRYRLQPELTIVSHGDSDHAGGLVDLAETGRLLSGEPDRVPGSEPCRAGQQWRFDGVSFAILWPRDGSLHGNAASCVLRIEAHGASVLLTGDITAQEEYRLLGEVEPVTVLQLAHHGSDTSNTRAWIGALKPRWAVASMGYANKFGHPRPQVVARLQEAGVTLLRTDRTGMIVFRLGGLDNAALITNWRRDHGRPWHGSGRWRFW